MGSLDFSGGWAVPGAGLVRESYEDAIWRENYDANRPYYGQQTIDGTSTDTGNTNNTTTLRAGLLMAKKDVSTVGDNQASNLVPWDPTATDGTEVIWGPLLVTMNMLHIGQAQDKWVGWILNGGLIRSASLIIPGETDAGLEGKTYGNLARESMANSGRFRFDDFPNTWQGNDYKAMTAVSGALTLQQSDSGKAFVLTGGATVTLPPVAGSQGLKFTFYGGAGGGSVAEAAGGDLLPLSPQTVSANDKNEVIGLDGTNYLFT